MDGVLFSVAHSVASRAVILIVNMLAIRLVSPADYGALSYLLTIVASFAVFSSFGAGVASNTYVSKFRESDPALVNDVILSSLSLVTVLAIAAGVVLSISVDKIHTSLPSVPSLLFSVILILMLVLMNVGSVAEGAMNGMGKYRRLAQNSMIVMVVCIPVSYLLLWALGAIGAVLAILIYRFLMVLLNGRCLVSERVVDFSFVSMAVFKKRNVRVLMGTNLPAVISSVMVAPVIAVAMGYVAKAANGLEELAYFSWVFQLYTVAVFIPGALGAYLLSRYAREENKKGRLLTVLMGNAVFSAVVMMLMWLAKPLLLGIAGEIYVVKSSAAFNFMMPAIFLYGLNTAFSSYWPAIGRNWIGVWANLIWALVLVLTVVVGLSDWGGASLALAFSASYLVQLLFQVASYAFLVRYKATFA